ncbi:MULTISPECIES: hypothetical protein [Vibrio]|uniref:Uncharacterized protein n=1 Tax=Vibrio tasmaniensis TaxID=212663 RepID=A0A2N7NNH8_9VIBR|nr:hypothetical protein [Vibrio tasmaniensis]PMO80318.1 hypothetical protein BCT01_08485 [Vibrio tasmaniensis]PMP17814.1 hypothetical protein BCS92_05245 [Vibrio tasmaniensis]TKG29019.1 hypothetical protein FC057_20245 [Vibrio tasmaniensis]TKG41582.1 hypothetical protein FC063_06905 [Vibrio tasmaniensis]TKG46231.1 hypothetical protein FC070_22370 [Vibrio tasmaniensis]
MLKPLSILTLSFLGSVISSSSLAQVEEISSKIEPVQKTTAVPGTLGAQEHTANSSNFEAGDATKKPGISSEEYDRLQFANSKQYKFHMDNEYPEYLKLTTTRSMRLKVLPNGQIKYTLTAGTLEENVKHLLSHTDRGISYFPEQFPASIRMYNSFDIKGENVLMLIDQMIRPWESSHQLWVKTHINNVVEFRIKN